ncbi:THAP domain-containing protein 1 [Pogonomyrmex barbatus]|uniref:THAP domain-containing protein 1 n=1 Tax=Pogonomyrmex barbatus TaxID=144034 RepID=A0A6I9W9Q7_9HYME|nr:THAP domain-containing protein 1 [Pogonomyrmex barbatus]
MVSSCCVEGCKASWRPDVDLSFFSFPLKNEDLLKEWLQVVPTNNLITKHSRICSNHFDQSQYECTSGKRKLKKNAIPNIFPQDLAKCKEILIEAEKLLSTSDVVLSNISNSDDFHCDIQEENMFLTYVSLPIPSVADKEIQTNPETQSVSTQTIPKSTKKEKELRLRIKNLQSKLHYKKMRMLRYIRLLRLCNAK